MTTPQSTDHLRELRKYIFDHFIQHSTPPVLEEVMIRSGLDRAEAFARFLKLEADHHILLVPGTQRILMANPFSAVTTPFRVFVAEREYFANCAWDTVSMHVMLSEDVRVESFCHHCAAPIEITLSGGNLASKGTEGPVIFLSVPVANWYDNLINTCSNNMVYFSSNSHMEEWLREHPGLKGESLDVELMAKVVKPLSEGRMQIGYERPPKEDLMRYWSSIGLKSAFWKF